MFITPLGHEYLMGECQFTDLALSIMGVLKKHPLMFLQ